MALLSRIIGSRLVRYGFVVLAVAGAAYAISYYWRQIGPAMGKIGLPMSLLALAITLLALVASMWAWRVLLAGLGSPLKFSVAARVMFVGQLGKYLPGSVWPVLAQMELASEHNVPRARAASAGLINMPVSVLSAFLAALVTLPFTGGSTSYLWFIAVAPVFLACLHPKVLNYLLGRMFKLTKRPPLEQPLTGRVIAVSVAWSFVSWLLYGVALWLLAIQVGMPLGTGYPLAVGAFAMGFAIGFLFIPAPAGAGVRDLVIIAILSHRSGLPTGTATAVAVVWRVVTLVADFIVAGLAMANRRGSAARQAPASPASPPAQQPPADDEPAPDENSSASLPAPRGLSS
jgi:uncharacterized membrane protein YbhN (UPF0104 family)